MHAITGDDQQKQDEGQTEETARKTEEQKAEVTGEEQTEQKQEIQEQKGRLCTRGGGDIGLDKQKISA